MDYPLFLVGVVVAFAMFGAALAYVDWIAARRPDPHMPPAE
jgi:hypothetical protein